MNSWLSRLCPPAALVILVVAGCGGSASPSGPVTKATFAGGVTATAAVTPAVTGSDPITVDAATVRRKGYDPVGSPAQTPDGFGQTLYAFHGVCHGSGDGYCQIMLFFIGTRYVGTDTANASMAISGYRPAGTGAIAVTYPVYGKTDPLCCPSGRPVTVVYRWNGSRVVRTS